MRKRKLRGMKKTAVRSGTSSSTVNKTGISGINGKIKIMKYPIKSHCGKNKEKNIETFSHYTNLD